VEAWRTSDTDARRSSVHRPPTAICEPSFCLESSHPRNNYTELSAAFFRASSSANRCVSFSRTTYENHCIQNSPNSAVQLLQYSTERAVHYSYTAR